MNPSEVQGVLSDTPDKSGLRSTRDTAGHGESDDRPRQVGVPVSESIRYRKRAQSAEKKIEELAEQLAEAKDEARMTGEQLRTIRFEQKLRRRLADAGTVDMETAVLLAKTKIEGEDQADMDNVVKQLQKEKQYLFAGKTPVMAARKTAGARQRVEGGQTVLERAAKRAATTGSRTDLQEYLKLRRNFV